MAIWIIPPPADRAASREVAHSVNEAHDVERLPANAVENEMLVEWLSHEEQPDSGELRVCVIRFLANPWMAGQQAPASL
jgi:hypothetical protein